MPRPSIPDLLLRTGLDVGKRLLWVGRQLWHEVTGSLFLALGVAGIPSTYRGWRDYQLARAIVGTIFVGFMLYFGITAFIRARRIGKEGASQ